MKSVAWMPSAIPNIESWVWNLASTSTYDKHSWRDLSKGRSEAKTHGLGKDAVMRPSSGKEKTSAPVPKPAKDNKIKRASTSEDPKLKTRMARKPRKNTIPLTEESVRHLRDKDEEEEEEENDGSILVAPVKKTIDASKAVGSMAALALHQAEFSKSRVELSQREADFQGLSEERNDLKLLSGKREEEIKDLRAELAKAHQDQTDLIKQVEADAIVAVYRANAEAAQVQAREAAETAQTRAYGVFELTKCQSRRKTLEEIHARGFYLTEEILKAKELEVDAGALDSDNDDDDDESKSGSESGEEPDGEETAPGDNQET
ncbi:uncharacterized protein [Nicotiana tomentosiformis]|uniref:uncharacterized protein n=1 Tax=Nicotiana tomentosiformis TaxID=4098 RepID=UPI00388C6EC9